VETTTDVAELQQLPEPISNTYSTRHTTGSIAYCNSTMCWLARCLLKILSQSTAMPQARTTMIFRFSEPYNCNSHSTEFDLTAIADYSDCDTDCCSRLHIFATARPRVGTVHLQISWRRAAIPHSRHWGLCASLGATVSPFYDFCSF